MPKTKSPRLLERYPPLRDIPEQEWDQVFDRNGQPWEADEDAYICEWYGRDHVVDIAYALGRVPWKVSERANKLGMRIGHTGRPKKRA